MKIAVAMMIGAGAAAAVDANDIFGRPGYAPMNLTRTSGYHDHDRNDGTWSIEATSGRAQRSGYASEMALYRAAEVAAQQGHPFFQLLRSEGRIGTGFANSGVETVSLIVRFVNSDSPPPTCLQRGRHPGTCYTADAAKVRERLEPRIRDASWRRDTRAMVDATAPVTDHSGLMRVTTLFRFDLNERGGIENCALVDTNAPAALNDSACKIFGKMGHYPPVRDAQGKPVRATRTARVVWQQSDLGGPTTLIPLQDEPAPATVLPAARTAEPHATAAPASRRSATDAVVLHPSVIEMPSSAALMQPSSGTSGLARTRPRAPANDTVAVPL